MITKDSFVGNYNAEKSVGIANSNIVSSNKWDSFFNLELGLVCFVREKLFVCMYV